MSETDSTSAAELPTTVKLSRPVQALDQEVAELKLRAPTGTDIAAVGYPVRISDDGAVEFLGASMTRMIARLAGVPLTTAKSLSGGDWTACAAAVAAFLGGGAVPAS